MDFKKITTLIFLFFLFYSCRTTKDLNNNSTESNRKVSDNDLIKEAKKYLGTPYKYGGTTKSGIDCSGFVFSVFSEFNVKLPRISSEQANQTEKIDLKNVKPGDLLFFSQTSSEISHVGIVERVENSEVFFIHSSTSKGVIISSLNNVYWNKRFKKAGRIKYS